MLQFELLKRLVLFLIVGFVTFDPAPSRADCLNPTGSESEIVYSSSQNVPMYCNGSQWIAMGKLNPAAGGSGCPTTTMGIQPEGKIFYNADYHVMQYCDGDDWQAVGIGRFGGFLGFTDLTDQPTSTVIISNILQVILSGSVSISGDGTPEYRICADAACSSEAQTWGPTAGTITAGQFLQLRLTSNAANSTINSANVSVDTGNDQWDVTTEVGDPCAGSPVPGDVCADGAVYAGLSPDGDVPMYTTPSDGGQFTWNNGTGNYIDSAMQNCTSASPGSQTSCRTGEANTALVVGLLDAGSPYDAALYCDALDAHGYQDWYLPAQDELNVLYTNRAAIGGFDTSGSYPSGSYWSSSENSNQLVKRQRFSDAFQSDHDKTNALSVRCVRK